jgi:extracellular elastinolytic metalloproteinase
MYLWNAFTPMKDGDFDSGIIIHEIGHGISNRLTGGPTVSGCLPGGQSGGMGEGWSDWWAIALQQKESFPVNKVFPMGDYVASGGIRIYPYSYDMTVNPATYGYISGPAYSGVHAMGSVWAGILYDVFVLTKLEFGFSADWYNGEAGSNALWQNVLDGLKLQPCAPTMVDARDGILLADEQNYGGKHVCTYWCAFGRRGLGLSASSSSYSNRDVQEAFDTPAACDCARVYAKAEAEMAANPQNEAFYPAH